MTERANSEAKPTLGVRSGSRTRAIIAVSLGIVVVLLLAWAVSLSTRDEGLSPLETILFGLFTVFLSVVATFVVAEVSGERRGRDTAAVLAKPALRRVLELGVSVGRITRSSERARQRLEEAALDGQVPIERVVDAFEGVEDLLAQHAGQLDAAVADWKDLLAEELEELTALNDLRYQLEAAVSELEEARSENEAVREEAKERVDALRKEFLEQRNRTVLGGATFANSPSWPTGTVTISDSSEGSLFYKPSDLLGERGGFRISPPGDNAEDQK